MSTLLLRFAAPLQSWGSFSRFNRRMTEREPTKSGVLGLAAAALGRCRDDDISDLTALQYGVRIDQIGRLLQDFQAAHSLNSSQPFISQRHYLADAVFLVALAGDDTLLKRLEQAVDYPVFPLSLGRRSCPPTGKLSLGLRQATLYDALVNEPWQAAQWYQKKQPRQMWLEIVCDSASDQPGAFARNDHPLSYSQEYRRYSLRYMTSNPRAVQIDNTLSTARQTAKSGDNLTSESMQKITLHDTFATLEDDNVSVEDSN